MNSDFDKMQEQSPLEQEALREATQNREDELRSANQQLEASNQQLKAAEQQLRAANQQLEANNQQLAAVDQQLRAMNQQLEETSRLAKVGGWSIDLVAQTLSWTSETYRIHELPYGKQLTVAEAIQFYHPDDRSAVDVYVQQAIDQGSSFDFQARIITTHKHVKWVKAYGHIVVKDGVSIAISGMIQDITENKIVTEALKVSEERLRTIFENGTDTIYSHSPDHILSYVSPQFETLVGYTPEEALVRWSDFLSDNPINQIGIELTQKAIDAGEIQPVYELEFIHKNGSKVQVEVHESPVVEDGKTVAIVGAISDITERKAAEIAIRDSEAKYRALYDNAPLSYQSLNVDGQFIDVNPTWLSTLGYAREEVIGEKFSDFLHPDWQGHFEKNFPAFKKRGYVNDVQFKIRHKKGHFLDISFEGCIGTHPDGSFKQTYCVFKDITEQKRAEFELEQRNVVLRKINDFSLELSMMPQGADVEQLINERIKEITGAEIAIFSEYNSDLRTMTTRHVAIQPGLLKQVVVLLGKQINKIQSFVSDAQYEEMTTRIVGVRHSLHEISFGAIPRPVGATIESLLQVDRFVALCFLIDGQLHGSTMLAMKKGQPEIQQEILEHLALLVAVALRRRRAEKALVKNQFYLSKAQETGKIGTWELDILKNELHWTKQNYINFGYNEETKLTYEKFLDCIYPDDRDYVDREWKAAIKGKPYDIEHRVLIDGKVRWLWEKADVTVDKKGRAVYAIGFTQDITEKKAYEVKILKAKEKSEQSEKQYRDLYTLMRIMSDTMSDMMWAKDLNNNYIFTNKAICDTLLNAVDTQEPIGKSDVYFAQRARELHPEDPEWHTFGEVCAETDAIVLKHMKKMQFDEYGYVKGKFLYLDVYKAPLYNVQGELIGVVGSGRDVTVQKHSEEELIRAKEKAEESDRLKSAFLSNMSHEIRTPMNGILGFTSLLKSPQLSGEKMEQYIQVIEKSGARMLSTINDIIDISRIEAGQVEVLESTVLVNKVLEDLYDFFSNEAKEKGLELIYTPTFTSKAMKVLTDQHKLEGVLTNLIKNAIKYTERGTVTLSCVPKIEQDSEYLEFSVTDTGIGIAPHRIDAVFNRFEQADIEDVRVYQGSGLGLAIAKSYVEMLGGSIRVTSQERIGSTFSFTLPYAGSLALQEQKESETLENASNLFCEKILIVAEDDEISQLFLETILTSHFRQVIYVASGRETINACREHPEVDIILMDIKMPDIDGYEATRQIRQFNKKVRIIAQTAFGLSGDKEKALAAGCDDYISKPINKEELFEKIQKCL